MSVGCLALWWRSFATRDLVLVYLIPQTYFSIDAYGGKSYVEFSNYHFDAPWQLQFSHDALSDDQSVLYSAKSAMEFDEIFNESNGTKNRSFEFSSNLVRFPLWYPALIFALAAVGVLRFRRQFSIRSALICLTVVAALLGMAVIL